MIDEAAKVKSAIDFLKNPNLFRDIIIFICGFSALLFFNFTLNLSENQLIIWGIFPLGKINTLSKLEIDFIVLIASYVIGRFLLIVSNIIITVVVAILNLLYKLVEAGLTNRIKWDSTPYKTKILHLLKPEIFKEASYNDVKNEITSIDTALLLEKIPSLASNEERNVYYEFFINSYVTVFFVASTLINRYFLIPFVLFLLLSIRHHRKSIRRNYEIYRAVIKHSHENKKST